MENIFNINRESNFKNGVVDSVPVGNNNIVIIRNTQWNTCDDGDDYKI